MEDADFLLELKNDPIMRQFAVVSHEKISMADHLNWLEKHINEIQIVELKQYWNFVKAGMFRVSDDKEVSINLHPKFRGQGLGQEVVSKHCPKGVWAKIVDGNEASMKLFLNNGFQVVDHKENYHVLKN